MDKVYKSNTWVLFRSFLGKLVWTTIIVLAIACIVQLGISKTPFKEYQYPFLILAVYIIMAIGSAFYFSFIRFNTAARVTDDGVTLLRGGEIYETFLSKDCIFSSYIVKQYYGFEAFTTSTARYLKVADKNFEAPKENNDTWNFFKGAFRGDNHKKYRLYFSKNDFEEFISIVISLNSTN